MTPYPLKHAPLKERKLRALLNYQADAPSHRRSMACTTLNEHNGEVHGFHRRDGTSVAPVEDGPAWSRLREQVEEIKRRRPAGSVEAGTDLGGPFMIDPWGNVAAPVENDRADSVWYANGKFNDLLYFMMPNGPHSHDSEGRYRVGERWRGPADGLSLYVDYNGHIRLSLDRFTSIRHLKYRDPVTSRQLEAEFVQRIRDNKIRNSRFYANYRSEAFSAETSLYLGKCPLSLIFKDPTEL